MTAPFDDPKNSYETLTWVRTEAGAVPVYTRDSARDQEGLTSLLRAARDGDAAQLRRLIEAGTPLDERDNNGWTALHWAAKSRQLKAAAELIAAGADTAAEARNGLTPLGIAVKSNAPAIITLLAGAGGASK